MVSNEEESEYLLLSPPIPNLFPSLDWDGKYHVWTWCILGNAVWTPIFNPFDPVSLLRGSVPKSVRCQHEDTVSPGGASTCYLHKLCFLGQLDCVPVSVTEASSSGTTLTSKQVCSNSLGGGKRRRGKDGWREGEKEGVRGMNGERG